MNCADLTEIFRAEPLAGWTCKPDDGFLRLETPLRYPDGGVIEVFVENLNDRLLVTDYGESFRFLYNHGIDPVRSAVRQQVVDLAVSLGGADISEDTIEITVDPGLAMAAAVRLGQIITRIADLTLTNKGPLGGSFSDVVEDFLRSRLHGAEIRRHEALAGAATKHRIDIVVRSAKGVSAIESLSASTPTGANAQTAYTIQKFVDLKAVGAGAPEVYSVIDNSSDTWSGALRRQLENVSTVIDWERRDDLAHALT